MSGRSCCDCFLWGSLDWEVFLFGRYFFFGDDYSACVVGLGDDIFVSEAEVGVIASSSFLC